MWAPPEGNGFPSKLCADAWDVTTFGDCGSDDVAVHRGGGLGVRKGSQGQSLIGINAKSESLLGSSLTTRWARPVHFALRWQRRTHSNVEQCEQQSFEALPL